MGTALVSNIKNCKGGKRLYNAFEWQIDTYIERRRVIFMKLRLLF